MVASGQPKDIMHRDVETVEEIGFRLKAEKLRTMDSTTKQIIERHRGEQITDEDVIHTLVELRRMEKKNQLGRWKGLWNELESKGVISRFMVGPKM